MSPRVSEAARIFAVAAFLVLIAQGPTFSGHTSQLAAANCAKNGAIVQCDEQKVDKKVEVEKGAPTVETKSGGDATKDPCSKENKASNYDAYKKAGCESKGEGKTTFKDENGNEKQVCTTCGGGGAVSEGSGGTSNPSAVDQYASGDNRPAISQVPVLASPTTADAMNRAFPGVADGTVKLAYPVTPSGSETSNAGGSSSPAPLSSVPGTTLDNSQPVNLNPNLRQEVLALAPPQSGADTPSITTRSYISPSTGATLGTNGVAQASFTPDPLWKANQELGGIQSPVSPSQVFVQATKNELSADINTAVPRLTDSLTSRSESVAAKVSDAQSKIDDLVAGGVSATQTGKLAELSTLKAEVAAGQNELQKITRTYDYLNNSATDPAMFARAYLDPQRQPLLDSFVSRYDAAAQSYSQASAPSAGADSIFGTIAANTTAGQAQQEMSFAQGQISQITGEAPLSDSMRIALQGAPQERTEVGQAYGWLTQQAGLSPADAADCAGTGSCLFRAMAAGAVKSAVDAVVRPVSMIFPSAMPYEMAAQNVQLSPTQQAVQWALDTTVTATNGAAIRALASGEGSIANVAARPVEITASGESGLVIADALPGTRAISFTESTVPITRTGSSYFGDIVPGATPEIGAGKSGASLSIGSDLAVGENVGQVAPDVIKLGSVRPGAQLAEPTGSVGAVTADASAANTLASAASRDWPFAGLPGTREDSGQQQQQPPTSVIPQGQAPGDTGGTSDQIASGSEGGAAKGKSAATGDAASSREDGGASPAGVQRVASMVQLPTTPLFSAEDKAAYAEAQARVNTSGKPEWVVLDVGLVEVRPKVSAPEIAQNGVPVGGASNAATNDAQFAVAGPYNGNQIASSQPAPQPTSPAPAAAEPEANAQKPAPPSTVLGNGLGGGVAGNGQGQGAPASGSPDAPPSQSAQEGEQKNPSKTDVAANGATGNGSPTGKNTEGSPAGQGSARGSEQGGQSQTTQGQSAGSMVQGSGQGNATQSGGTSGGGTGVASANKTTPASGQGTAPSQSQPAQETKTAQQKCDDVNAHPSKYGAADIENCKSNTERKVAAILGGIASILNTINPFASSAAQAAPARTPMQLNYNLWGIKAPGGNAAEPAGLETGTLARSLCGGGGLTPREGFQQGGGRLMCNFASPEDAVAAYMSKIDAYCNKLGMCTPKQVVCTWVTGADCDISKLDTAYQNLVNKLGNIDLHNDANKVQFMIAQAVPENSISQFPYSQQQIDAGVQKWRASLGKTVATTQAPVTSPASAPPSVQISSVTKAVSSGIIRVALPPGEKPVASPTSASLQKDAGLQISVCVGTAKCGDGIQFNSRNYINPLCQKDLGCTASASELAGVPDAKYPEQAFKDPLSSQAQQYYQQQVERAAQNASQGRVLIDNCNNVDYAVCKTILDKLQAWNQQHPAQPVKAWINNAHFETDTNTLPLWSHPVAGGATVEQDIENPQESSPAYLDKRRQEAGVPGLPILFAGSEQYAAEVQRQIQQGGYPGMGTSGSKVGDGPNGFKTADATSAISGQAGPNTPVGAMQRFAQTAPAFVFGRSGADGKPELLDPKTAAQAQAKGEKLDVYENVKPLPFRAQQYTKVGDQYYQRAGTADEYAARQTAGAQAALQNGAYAQQLGSKMDKPVMIEGQGSTRPVYGLNADGSKGDPLGTLKTMSKEQVQLLNAAQKLGVELKECDTGYCTKDGKQAELRAENGGKPGDAPRTVGGVSGQNRRVWNPNVQARTPTTEERVGALKAAGVKVVDNRGAGAYPARSGAIVGEFVHGDLASGEKLVSYCAQTRKCYNDIVMEDGTVVMMGGTDKAPFHAFGAADYTNGIVVAGADGGRSATPAQLETVRKILSVDMDQFGWWVTTHGESAANSIGGRNINEAGPNVRAMIFDGGIPAGDQQLGLYLSDPANPNDRGTRFGDVFNASSLPPARESATFTSTDGKTIVGLDPVGDVGKATASLTTDSDGNLGVNYNYEAPKPPETPDTRSPIEKIRDAAASANERVRDMWKNMFGGVQQPAGGQQGGGGAQPANNAVPANNSRPAGGAAQPSSSGTPAPAPARTGQQPATTANGASGSQMPAVSVSGGNTATGISGERFTCSPGTVVNGSTATPLTIAWTCPAGTTSIGTGFSTLGTNSGSVQLVVSTTSASVNYQLTCQGAQASQTLSCAVQVRHPRVTLVAKPASVESGAPVQLQWSAFDVTSCSLYAPPTVLLVSGGTQGTANTLPLSRSSVFSALCNIGTATTTASVTVLVKGDTATPLQTVLPR